MGQPVYVHSDRWGGCLLRTDGRPAGYGRAITPAQIIMEAVHRDRARAREDTKL